MRCSLTYADFADKESSPNFRVLRYVLKESFAYVRTRIQQRFRFFAVTSVTAGEKMEFYSLPLKVLFCKKRRVTFQKTTGHFSKNDGLFVGTALTFSCCTYCRFSFSSSSTKARRLALSSLYELRKSYFWWLFGDIARSKSKQMFTKTHNKHNINLLH